MTAEPVRLFFSYAHEDEGFADELGAHLQPLVRRGEIRVWGDRQIAAGQDWAEAHARELESARMIVLLVSASFLASERTYEDLDAAMQRRRAGEAQVVPILVRPCDWRSGPLEELQPLPRNQLPVASWSNRDEAWAEIARELRSLLEFGADRVQPAPTAAPHQVRSIDDIFRTVGQPDITFVEPAQFKTLRRCLRAMGKGLVVEGPSGVGKTTLVSRALREVPAMEQEWLFGQMEDDQRKIDERLSKGFLGHLVIDDFHRLDHARQARVADAMKIVADRDARNAKITLIGINPVGDSLVSALRDLAGRFDVVPMGSQPDEKISELIRKGEEAANISFRRREELILGAGGSFFIAQQLCQEAALKADIEETAPALTYVDVGFRDVVKKMVDDLDSRYFGDLRTFACHDERVPPRGASLALLWLLAQSSEGHVTMDEVHYRFPDPDLRDALGRLKSSYLSRCFEEARNLKSLLYYNRNAGVLSIEDPRLAFYLRHMSWPRFIERTGHQNARIDAEGKLVFSRRRPSERPPERERLVNVLHLSDLHFSQVQQADVWYGQLAEDLKELECDRLDVLVLSGDLTQRADRNEFEAARRFLLRLSTDARLSPGQVVVVPGNHDVSWPLSKDAYSLHRREDYAGALEEGKYIAHGPTVVEARDEAAYKRRFEPFAELYAQIKGAPYPLDYEGQIDVQDFAKENLLFVGFNSAWETDHYFRSRASIHPEALSRVLDRIRRSPAWAGRLKIAVWHHPLTSPGEDRIKDHGFLQQLAKAGFRVILHGHVHKADRGLFRYDMAPDGRRIEVVGAGTFGAPTAEWVPGYPLQYNLLRISKDRIVVETRRREEPNGAWQPDARWLGGPGKDPLPRYEIELNGAGAPPPSSRG
jgi:3',5'-cyclic AMP phosphodiesterase CpdA